MNNRARGTIMALISIVTVFNQGPSAKLTQSYELRQPFCGTVSDEFSAESFYANCSITTFACSDLVLVLV